MSCCNNKYRFKVYTPEADGYIRINHRHLIVKGITTEGAHVDVKGVIDAPLPLELMINDTDFCNVGNLTSILSAADMRGPERHLIGSLILQPDIVGTATTTANGFVGFNKKYLSVLSAPSNFTGNVLMTVNRQKTGWTPDGGTYTVPGIYRGYFLDEGGLNEVHQYVIYATKIPPEFQNTFGINGVSAPQVDGLNDTGAQFYQRTALSINGLNIANVNAYVTDGQILNISVPVGTVINYSTSPGSAVYANDSLTMEIPFVNGAATILMPEFDGIDKTIVYTFTGGVVVKQNPLLDSNIIYVGVLIENANNVEQTQKKVSCN